MLLLSAGASNFNPGLLWLSCWYGWWSHNISRRVLSPWLSTHRAKSSLQATSIHPRVPHDLRTFSSMSSTKALWNLQSVRPVPIINQAKQVTLGSNQRLENTNLIPFVTRSLLFRWQWWHRCSTLLKHFIYESTLSTEDGHLSISGTMVSEAHQKLFNIDLRVADFKSEPDFEAPEG